MKWFARLTVVAVILMTGCQSVNTTSGGSIGVQREQRMFMGLSSSQVDGMSKLAYDEMLQEAGKKKALNKDKKNLDRLNRIADRLVSKVGVFRQDASSWDWQINLIDSKELNASCLPGGRIIFFSGIIDQLKLTDDEIAAIMGHEIAHALREHGREAMSEAYMVQVSGNLASVLLGVDSGTMGLANQVVQYAMTLPNSREKEAEADLIGLELMSRAGFNPEASISLWEKMSSQNGQRPPEFMSTHPAIDTRISGLRYNLPKVIPLYKQAL